MGKSRFFKAYFIASLLYAVWFGVLMYAVDPMFLDVMECNTLPGDFCVCKAVIPARSPLFFIRVCPS